MMFAAVILRATLLIICSCMVWAYANRGSIINTRIPGRLYSQSSFDADTANPTEVFPSSTEFPRTAAAAPHSYSDVVVIGGGLCGLTAAHECVKAKKSVSLFEMQSHLGGNIASKSREGLVWEEGPNSFQPTETILNLCQELGITDEIAYADPSLPRYIATSNSDNKSKHKNRNKINSIIGGADAASFSLTALPHSFSQFLSTKLFDFVGKLRILQGLLGLIDLPAYAVKSADSGSASASSSASSSSPMYAEETIKSFFTRHFGSQLYDRLVDPFISGVYAGDGGRLSISAAFPKIRAFDPYQQPIDNIHHDRPVSASPSSSWGMDGTDTTSISSDGTDNSSSSGSSKTPVTRYSRSMVESMVRGMLNKLWPFAVAAATATTATTASADNTAAVSSDGDMCTDCDDIDHASEGGGTANRKAAALPPSGSLCNFQCGMQTLTNALVQRLTSGSSDGAASVRTGYKAIRVHFDHEKGVYLSTFRPVGVSEGATTANDEGVSDITVASDHVVIATPAFVTAEILKHSTQSATEDTSADTSSGASEPSARRPRVSTLPEVIRNRREHALATDDRRTSDGQVRLFPASVASLLEEIVYCPVASVITAYPISLLKNDTSTNHLHAFGHLIPRSTRKPVKGATSADTSSTAAAAAAAVIKQRLAQQAAKGYYFTPRKHTGETAAADATDPFTTLGVIWSSQLFDGRVSGKYKDHVVFTSFVGGMHSLEGGEGGSNSVSNTAGKNGMLNSPVLQYSDRKLLNIVNEELLELLGKKGANAVTTTATTVTTTAATAATVAVGDTNSGMIDFVSTSSMPLSKTHPHDEVVKMSRFYRLAQKVDALRVVKVENKRALTTKMDKIGAAATSASDDDASWRNGDVPTTSGDTTGTPFLSLDESEESLLQTGGEGGVVKQPRPVLLGIKRWARGIPQFELGYQERMRNVLDQMKKPTFTEFNKCLLVGNYVTGVSIHDCIHNTKEILKHNYIV